eukprot:TRINITY_DN10461_c0_g2_i1.p1 TRINITY_DN10461_c0_g2~~TRINITY_DN10461_c0_g2_i1.p1  ORF type:complete len:302 (-),score=46.93 TRINITY_DN10461_c0_g2_i1:84-989(-)
MADDTRVVSPLKVILSGSVAGGIEAVATYPLEFAKFKIQLSSRRTNLFREIVDTFRSKGFLAIYRGVGSTLLFATPRIAVRYLLFEQIFKKYTLYYSGREKLSVPQTMFCGLFTGATEAVIVTTASETMKVKLISDHARTNPRYNNILHGIATVFKEEGISGIYKGMLPTVVKVAINQSIRFSLFIKFKGFFERHFSPTPGAKKELPALALFGIGACSGMASVYFTHPLDIIKTLMQKVGGVRAPDGTTLGSFQIARQVWREQGYRGFFKGVAPRLGRVAMEVGLTMTLFDKVVLFFDTVM